MYWLKIMKKHDSLVHEAFSKQVKYSFNNSWSSKLCITLNNLGYNYLLQNYNTQFNYKSMLKQRIRDNYIQVRNAQLNESNKLFTIECLKLNSYSKTTYLLQQTNVYETNYQDLGYPLIIWKSKRGDIMVLLEKKDYANYVTLKLLKSNITLYHAVSNIRINLYQAWPSLEIFNYIMKKKNEGN